MNDPIATRIPAPRRRSRRITTAEAIAHAKSLERDIARLEDRIRRLSEVIDSEILFWSALISGGEGEGIEAAKRRLSRLKGSLQYPGIP